ncbi:MAG: segregation/condensation protein A [Desulfitobacteriaceae bacterium]|nr:segregation/condensation protein A [Clostridia bacterium]MDD4345489.1 segregation/condensation protein A [Desulfitobacteriaceae bacterium]MDD4400634.1 segregation/condensation protein A [Desulfitobacteriaceae bacterium]
MDKEHEWKSLHFDVPAFQGPLDLLLQLIQQEKVDIYDIPVARITDQFIAAVRQMGSLDMEVTSEFLVMAAQLLYLKSRFLLPCGNAEQNYEETDEDPRQELVERLLAYKTYKSAARVLSAIESSSGQTYFREVDVKALLSEVSPPDPLHGISIDDLWQAFFKVVHRVEKGAEIKYIQPEDISLEVIINDVLRRVILQPRGMRFQKLMHHNSRLEAIMVFLALLELLKSGKVKAEQVDRQADIFIFPTPKAWEFAEN